MYDLKFFSICLCFNRGWWASFVKHQQKECLQEVCEWFAQDWVSWCFRNQALYHDDHVQADVWITAWSICFSSSRFRCWDIDCTSSVFIPLIVSHDALMLVLKFWQVLSLMLSHVCDCTCDAGPACVHLLSLISFMIHLHVVFLLVTRTINRSKGAELRPAEPLSVTAATTV